MLAKRRIRSQMYIGALMLFAIVFALSAASFQGVLKFRKLTKSIKERAIELPLAAELSQKVSDLESAYLEARRPKGEFGIGGIAPQVISPLSKMHFSKNLKAVEQALENYRQRLRNSPTIDPRITDNTQEMELVDKFQASLDEIIKVTENEDWFFGQSKLLQRLPQKIDQLQSDANRLPGLLQQRMEAFSEQARTEYHTWILLTILMTALALGFIAYLFRRFRNGIFLPLETLVTGSRQVANGNYDYRIQLNTNDEVSELADALNAMTQNFQEIKSDLNQQVKERTKEVVRSEKMASVGFLAAGVAHEINNPLASIAWSAESLEMRLHEILNPAEDMTAKQLAQDIEEMKKYLRRIQEEAFRCKGITAGLLDFSRMGDARKIPANLREVVESVLEIVKPLSKYRDKNLHFESEHGVYACINPQELKQVAMNLVTNALDSVDVGGVVTVTIEKQGEEAVLIVSDDGCGMTPEVQEHLFEPFFTRRRDGQGTGLGLSITYSIIEEHGGRIIPKSDGVGKGSSFTVILPLVKNEQQKRAA